MIIYGTKVIQLQSEKIEGEFCSACGKKEAMFIFSYAKYFHVFWIPFFPAGKLCVHACGSCSKTLQEKEMTPSMRAVSDKLKSRSSAPGWTYIGLLLFAILVVYGIATAK